MQSKKLKMVRADLFAVLAVCQSASIVTFKKQSNAIKKGINYYANSSQSKVIPDTVVFLQDWDRILEDKFNKNTVQEIMRVNSPNF